jgi:hypothetical protein
MAGVTGSCRPRPAARDRLPKALPRAIRKKPDCPATCASKDRGDGALAQDPGHRRRAHPALTGHATRQSRQICSRLAGARQRDHDAIGNFPA